MNIARTAT